LEHSGDRLARHRGVAEHAMWVFRARFAEGCDWRERDAVGASKHDRYV